MKKKLIAVLTALLIISTQELVVFAAPAAVQESRQEYTQLEAEVAYLQEQVNALDDEIAAVNATIEDNNAAIANAQQQMEEKRAEIAKLEEELAPIQEIYDAKVRQMYKNRSTSIIEVLLQTESFGDFISTLNSVAKILSIDNDVITEYNEGKENIEVQLKELEAEAQELEALNQENQRLTSELEEKRQSQNTLLAEAQSKLDQINEYKAASLISYAYKFLGTPYVWGGTTPSGFDCSGFTQYVFRQFGYSIGRTTYDQIYAGKSVSRSEMKPGDLVFTHAGHVGIYLGNNQFIHAPQTGDVLKVSTVNKFYAARRILQ